MGWTYGWSSASELRAHLNDIRSNGNVTVVMQRATAYGRHVWTLYETKSGERFINLDLLAGNARSEWGYKDMSEDMGPCYYDCPLELLEAATEPVNEYARAWREKVRAYHAARRQTFANGDRVRIGEQTFRVLGPYKRSWRVERESDGHVYKARGDQMERVEPS
jgi:hypothetical protein